MHRAAKVTSFLIHLQTLEPGNDTYELAERSMSNGHLVGILDFKNFYEFF